MRVTSPDLFKDADKSDLRLSTDLHRRQSADSELRKGHLESS